MAVVLCACLGTAVAVAAPGTGAQAAKKKGKAKKQPKNRVFLVCKHGCKFHTIQRGVDAAGSFKHKPKNAEVQAIVKVKPGKYVEGVVLDGRLRKKEFDGLKIVGLKENPRKQIL
jgi:pectin methylesterase-like acyl-CoA thioesterase